MITKRKKAKLPIRIFPLFTLSFLVPPFFTPINFHITVHYVPLMNINSSISLILEHYKKVDKIL